METTTTTVQKDKTPSAGTTALAVVGFIALLIIGIGLAIYSARFVPEIISRMGANAVDYKADFKPAADPKPGLSVVTSTTTIPFGNTPSAPATGAPVAPRPVAPVAPARPPYYGPTGYTTITTVNPPQPRPLYGQADLTVTITDTGYLRTEDTDSFVSSDDVPDGERGAVRFTVTNIGTNVSDEWEFEALIPSDPIYDFDSPEQRSLRPGDRIEYTLGFTEGREGDDRQITITVDSDEDVDERSESNNKDSARVDIDD